VELVGDEERVGLDTAPGSGEGGEVPAELEDRPGCRPAGELSSDITGIPVSGQKQAALEERQIPYGLEELGKLHGTKLPILAARRDALEGVPSEGSLRVSPSPTFLTSRVSGNVEMARRQDNEEILARRKKKDHGSSGLTPARAQRSPWCQLCGRPIPALRKTGARISGKPVPGFPEPTTANALRSISALGVTSIL
jgi:hypothetical protein